MTLVSSPKKIFARASFVGVMLSILGLAYCGHPAYAKDDNAFEGWDRSTVQVITETGSGSAVYLGKGYFVTASHVADRVDQSVDLITEHGHKLSARPVFWDGINDLSILRADSPSDIFSTPVACRQPIVGEPITVRGYPLDLGFLQVDGHVAGPFTHFEGSHWRIAYALDATVAPGNSGGGVFDASGALLGVIVGVPAFHGAVIAIGIAIPSTILCSALDLIGETR
jgi:S1-C subfamily serine protease